MPKQKRDSTWIQNRVQNTRRSGVDTQEIQSFANLNNSIGTGMVDDNNQLKNV